MNLRKSYAQNRLARSITGGGKAPADIDTTMSQSKQELHSEIALSIEGMKPVYDDDYEIDELVQENGPDDEMFHGFTTEELTITCNPFVATSNANSIGQPSTSAGTSANVARIDLLSVDANDATSMDSIPPRPSSTSSNSSKQNIKENWHGMRSGPSMALLRPSNRTPRKKNETITAAHESSMQAAKRRFYENEELRAAERHKTQMVLWEEGRKQKQIEHEKRLQLYEARIKSLQSHRSAGPMHDENDFSDSETCDLTNIDVSYDVLDD